MAHVEDERPFGTAITEGVYSEIDDGDGFDAYQIAGDGPAKLAAP